MTCSEIKQQLIGCGITPRTVVHREQKRVLLGLRVGEIVQMKLKDVDSKRMTITLRGAKGMKDRQVMLSERLLLLLREYFKAHKPKLWLFEGQNGERYSTRSLQKVLERAKEKAGVKKRGSVHAL